jgi:integrase
VARPLRRQRSRHRRRANPEEYGRLLATYALRYFDERTRLRELDRRSLGAFVTWLTRERGPRGPLCDRSIRNALTPLRGCLQAAHAEGLVDGDLCPQLVLPRRRGGKPYEFVERRFLTRSQLARLLEEVPVEWRPFFDLLAATGLRISEAIALRVMDLDAKLPAVHVRRAIVDGQLTIPKSRHGLRTVPISPPLAASLSELAATREGPEDLLFRGPRGGPVRPNNLRRRVLIPASERAGVPWRASTPCVIPAPRCWRRPVPALYACSAGLATTQLGSHSTPMGTASTETSARVLISAETPQPELRMLDGVNGAASMGNAGVCCSGASLRA